MERVKPRWFRRNLQTALRVLPACPLDLWDPKESAYYADLIGGLYHFPPKVLNPWLERDVPLRPRQVEGVIVAHGYVSVPPQCHDETRVTVKLLLEDERRNELCFDFRVGMDRSVMRKCERRQRERREFARSVDGRGLVERKGLRDQQSAFPGEALKQPHAGVEPDADLGLKNSGSQTRGPVIFAKRGC